MELTSKTNQQFVYLLNIMHINVVAKLLTFFLCFWISRFIYNREKREIKYRLGSIIVHLRRGQDVELILRRTKLRFGWTLSSTAESNVELTWASNLIRKETICAKRFYSRTVKRRFLGPCSILFISSSFKLYTYMFVCMVKW